MANESSTEAAQRRRVTKPLMERRRRARINRCLAQLQEFLGSSITRQSQPCQRGFQRQTRLEKADILEMTVRYIREASHQQSPATLPDIDDHSSGSDTFNDCAVVNLSKRSTPYDYQGQHGRFQEGYNLCMFEVAKFARTFEPGRDDQYQKQTKSTQILSDRNPERNKEPSVNAPVKERIEETTDKNLSISRCENVVHLLKHLRDRYEIVAKEILNDSPSPPMPSIISGEVKGQNRSLSRVETSPRFPHPRNESCRIEKVDPRSIEFGKEVNCQNNFWWRPW